MTKKKIYPLKKYHSLSFKVEETVLQTQAKSMPTNLAEEKEKFLKSGKTPKFEIQDPSKISELASKPKSQIRFDLKGEAEFILNKVWNQFGNGEFFMEQAFGVRITKELATPMVLQYIDDNALTESLRIHWCDNIPCSAKMVWTGPLVNANKPELRKYSLWINSTEENNYMRESGIKCLMDHEIGTHFFRMFNDGLQPWFSDRARFGLRNVSSFEGQCTEEGLATINTILRGKIKLLWSSALTYYTACKAAELTFKQLFEHIGCYITNPDYRWKQVMRVKRGLEDPNDLGGFGNDQCYFEGAVSILRNMDNIDFNLLMIGKVCYDELDRIKRVARRDVGRLPVFMKNMNAYRRSLKKIAALNGLNVIQPQSGPPSAYLKRLEERRSEKWAIKEKVRHKSQGQLTEHGKKMAEQLKVDEPDEIASFSFDNRMISNQLQKLSEKNSRKEEDKVINLMKSVSSQLNSLDGQLDEQIQQLKDIVKEHTWVSDDYCYRTELLRQASGNMSLHDDIVLSEICYLGVKRTVEEENKIEDDIKQDMIQWQSSNEGHGDRRELNLSEANCPQQQSHSQKCSESTGDVINSKYVDVSISASAHSEKKSKTLKTTKGCSTLQDRLRNQNRQVHLPFVAKSTPRENKGMDKKAKLLNQKLSIPAAGDMKKNYESICAGNLDLDVNTTLQRTGTVFSTIPASLQRQEKTLQSERLANKQHHLQHCQDFLKQIDSRPESAPSTDVLGQCLLDRDRSSQSLRTRNIRIRKGRLAMSKEDITILPLLDINQLKARNVLTPTNLISRQKEAHVNHNRVKLIER